MKMGCYHHFKVEETEAQTSQWSKLIRDEVEIWTLGVWLRVDALSQLVCGMAEIWTHAGQLWGCVLSHETPATGPQGLASYGELIF